jgi:hypothetical protein
MMVAGLKSVWQMSATKSVKRKTTGGRVIECLFQTARLTVRAFSAVTWGTILAMSLFLSNREGFTL